MDRWRKAYQALQFGDLDGSLLRFLLYGVTAAFWVQVAVWLLLRKELIPGVEDVQGWLTLSLLALPGNIRAVFFIALGPNPAGEREAVREKAAQAEAPRQRRRIRFRLRKQWKRAEQSGRGELQPDVSTNQGIRGGQNPDRRPAPPVPGVPVQHRQPAPKVQKGSAGGTLVKVMIGLLIFATCGGYWLTGGTIVDPSDKTTEPPRLRNQAEKRHMVELINEARAVNGVPPVRMGNNNVAQIQADQLLEECVFSHWGTDGLKPYMRYSLAGGYQNNGENVLTYNECDLMGTWLQWNDDPQETVGEAVESLLESPGHRDTMLDPSYSRMNIGLAWDRNTFKVVQHFEGDFVKYGLLPAIQNGRLKLEGSLKNGHRFAGRLPLFVVVIYDPAPVKLTRTQLARTSCYGHGELVAMLLPPSLMWKEELRITETFEEPQCVDPYMVEGDAQEPETVVDISELWEEAKRKSDTLQETELTMTLRRAEQITAEDDYFSVAANVQEILEEHGPGVYTVVLVADLEDGLKNDEQVISEYSVFHRVRSPGTYGGR